MADQSKQEKYLAITKQIVELVGGKDNIQASTHCATRLRVVLKDYDGINTDDFDAVDMAKGAFFAGNQLQIIFGAGLVNEIYEVFADYTGTAGKSMAEVKEVAAQKMNPVQAVIKSLSDVFIEIMPGILAAALLSGLTGVLSQWDVVATNATLSGINRLVGLASSGIFSILPLAVCYSACKRYGGRPILGLVMGAIMLSNSLADAYAAAQGTVDVELISLFGLNVELVGFQGGIIIALMMGFVVAKLDKFFERVIPDVVKLLFSPMCTVLISTLFGISEPAIFGVNLRWKFPLVAGCIAGAVAGAYVFLAGVTALGFGTTALPGLAICDPVSSGIFGSNGCVNYIIAHVIALVVGAGLTIVFGKVAKARSAAAPAA